MDKIGTLRESLNSLAGRKRMKDKDPRWFDLHFALEELETLMNSERDTPE